MYFVPLDDRPVTYQLPRMLGDIAGQPVVTPPRAAIGRYLTPGNPDAILRWLAASVTPGSSVVASTDMIAYGGLVASRLPAVPEYEAVSRLRGLAATRDLRSPAFVAAFGTIVRLAPTGVPAGTPGYYASGGTVDAIAAYANLPDPPASEDDRGKAARLRAQIGDEALGLYLNTRARNRDVDAFALQLAAEGAFDRIVLGQDDAGPQGLHLRDVAALTRAAHRFALGDRASIEPGADELGMALVARAFARNVRWAPAVRVAYSRPEGGETRDQLEFVPIDATIARLVGVCGGRVVSREGAEIALFVRVPGTSPADESAFVDAISEAVASGASVAVADLTFLHGPTPSAEQQELVRELLERRVAGRIDAFASWNTTANTVGTALAEAIAAGAGRRAGTYDALAHAEFTLNRYADDYAFHQFVRPVLNADLRGRGFDVTLLPPGVAAEASSANRALLWPLALDLLAALYPSDRDAGLTITLPWDRTFETQLDVRLAPSP